MLSFKWYKKKKRTSAHEKSSMHLCWVCFFRGSLHSVGSHDPTDPSDSPLPARRSHLLPWQPPSHHEQGTFNRRIVRFHELNRDSDNHASNPSNPICNFPFSFSVTKLINHTFLLRSRISHSGFFVYRKQDLEKSFMGVLAKLKKPANKEKVEISVFILVFYYFQKLKSRILSIQISNEN